MNVRRLGLPADRPHEGSHRLHIRVDLIGQVGELGNRGDGRSWEPFDLTVELAGQVEYLPQALRLFPAGASGRRCRGYRR